MVTQNIMSTCVPKNLNPTNVDLNESFNQVKLPITPRMCASIAELPSNIGTMEWGGKALSVIRNEKKNQCGC